MQVVAYATRPQMHS